MCSCLPVPPVCPVCGVTQELVVHVDGASGAERAAYERKCDCTEDEISARLKEIDKSYAEALLEELDSRS